MSSLPYLNIAGYFIKYGGVVTVFTNSLLIYLTCKKIKTIHFTYKCLIVLMAFLGIVFSLLEIVLNPFTHSYNASFIYFSGSEATGNSLTLKFLLLCAFSTTYMIIICFLAIQFTYRYLALLSPKFLKLFNTWRAVIWVMYSLACTVFWIAALNQISPDSYSKKYLNREMEENYGFDVEYLAQYHLVAYDDHGSLRMHNFYALCLLTAILVFQYIIILYFGFKTHTGIKAAMSVNTRSAKTHNLHTQLFKTLVLQITIPSIFYNSPVFLMYLIPYLGLQISCPSGVMICAFSLYPATDSMILMWMFAEYQKIIKKALGKLVQTVLKWSDVREEDSTTDEAKVEMRRM